MSDKVNKKLAEIRSLWGDGEPVYSRFRPLELFCLFLSKWKYNLTKGIFYKLKYFYQRHTRGYDDLDKWNAAWYIARKAIPVLTAMRNSFKGTSLRWHREDRHGNIIELTHDEVFAESEPIALTENEWCEIIDDIIYAFKFVLDEDDVNNFSSFSQEEYEKNKKKHKRGLKLFSIYLMSLWD